MSRYRVVVRTAHESFSGHEHIDGDEVYEVNARNEEYAIKRVRKEFERKFKNTRVYISYVNGIKSVTKLKKEKDSDAS